MNYLSKSLEYNNFYIANEILSKEGIIGNDEINKLRFIDYNKNETTALIHATCKKQIEIVDKLLKIDGIDVNEKNQFIETALFYACYNGDKICFDKLVSKGAKFNLVDFENVTLLNSACSSKTENKYIVEQILSNTKEFPDYINKKNNSGRTALRTACLNGHFNIIDILLENGASFSDIQTALMIACQNGSEKIVEKLVKIKGVNVNTITNGETALMYACYHGHEKIVECLLNNDVNIYITNGRYGSALSYTCISINNVKMMKFLSDKIDYNNESIIKEQKELINRRDISYNIKLLLPQFFIHHVNNIILNIIETGSNIVFKKFFNDEKKESDEKFSEIKIKFVTSLIQKRQTNNWFEIFIYMIKNKMTKEELEKFLYYLIIHFKFPTKPDTSTETSEDDIICILNIILKKYEDVSLTTALTSSCYLGYKKIVEILLDRNSNIFIKDDNGDTALIRACASEIEQVDIVEMLLKRYIKDDKENINFQNNDGKSALIFACERGYTDTVKLLLNKMDDFGLVTDYDKLIKKAAFELKFSTLIYLLNILKTNGKLLLNENILEIIYNETPLNNDALSILLFFYGNQIDEKTHSAQVSTNRFVDLLVGKTIDKKTKTCDLLNKSIELFGASSIIVKMIVRQDDINSVYNNESNCSYISGKYEFSDENESDKIFYNNIFEILCGYTTIHDVYDLKNCFTICSSVKMIDILLAKDIDINFKDENGQSCLIHSVSVGKVEIVSHLLENGADVNIVDNNGNNALYHAINYGEFHSIKSFKLMKLLIDQNINLKKFNYDEDNVNIIPPSDEDDGFNLLVHSIITLKTLDDSFGEKTPIIEKNDIAIEIWKKCLNNFANLDCWTTVKKILKYFKEVDKDFFLKFQNNETFLNIIREYGNKLKKKIVKILLEEKKDVNVIFYINKQLGYSLSEIIQTFPKELCYILKDNFLDDINNLEDSEILILFNYMDMDNVVNDDIINIFFQKINYSKLESKLEIILKKIKNYGLIKNKLLSIFNEYNYNKESESYNIEYKKKMKSSILLLFNFLFEKKDSIIDVIINELDILSFKILVKIMRNNNEQLVIEYIEQILASEEASEEKSKDKEQKKLFMTYNKNNIHNNKNLNKLIAKLKKNGYTETVDNLQNYKNVMNNHFETVVEGHDKKNIVEIVEKIYNKLQLKNEYKNDYLNLLKICLTNHELVDVKHIEEKYKKRLSELISFIKTKETSFDFNSGFKFDSDGFEYIGDKLLKIIVETQYDEYEKHFLNFLIPMKITTSNHKKNIQTNLFLHKLMDEHKINEDILTLSAKYYVTIIPNGGSFYKEEKQLVNESKGGDKPFENIWGADFLESIIFTLFLYEIQDSSGITISLDDQLKIIVEWWSEFNNLDEITEIINNFKNSISTFLSHKSDGAFIEEYISDGQCHVNGDEIFENMDSGDDD